MNERTETVSWRLLAANRMSMQMHSCARRKRVVVTKKLRRIWRWRWQQ